MADAESVLSLSDVLRVVWKRLWLILIAMTVGVGLALAYSFSQTPQYEASVSILIRPESGGLIEDPLDTGGLTAVTKSMNYAVRTAPVAEEVIRRLNLNTSASDVLGNLSSEAIPDTQFLVVRYRDSDPTRAQLMANTVGEAFSEMIADLRSTDADSAADSDRPTRSPVSATVWEPAQVPVDPVSPQEGRNALLGLLVGAILGVGLVFLVEYLDGSWRSTEEAEQITGLPTFGVIPRVKVPPG
jgi:capsular polysaccharide biosynthesis protein